MFDISVNFIDGRKTKFKKLTWHIYHLFCALLVIFQLSEIKDVFKLSILSPMVLNGWWCDIRRIEIYLSNYFLILPRLRLLKLHWNLFCDWLIYRLIMIMHTHTACSVLRNKKLKVVFNFRKKNFPLILKHDFRSKILELTLTKFHLSWPISKMWSVFFFWTTGHIRTEFRFGFI